MSRNLTSAVNTIFESSSVTPFLAINLAFDGGNFLAWTGYGNITFDSTTFVGAGDFLSVSPIKESSEVQANGIDITLSGVPSSLISSALNETYQGRSCKLYLGVLDSSNAVVSDPYVLFSGRMDLMNIDDSGEKANISVTAESRLIDLDRTRERRYTSEDQKIDFPNDQGLEFITDLQDKEIIWGR
tara:strand:- start:21 stop:578 length:558 start_codon:yes stop_codon:yes gene_type:complete